MPRLILRLYRAGDSPNSVLAAENLREICEAYSGNEYEVEVIDVLKEPLRAMSEGVLVTPLLVKVAPAPECRIIGNFSDRSSVVHALGLTAAKDSLA